MTKLRFLLADRLNGGILAALLVYAFLFQSIAGSIASAHMAGMQIDAFGVICETPDPAHRNHDSGRDLHECCAVLCQVACGPGIACVPSDRGGNLGPEYRDLVAAPSANWLDIRPPRHRAIRREARAPPHLSV